ncbi:MAG: hypothetical protein H6973_20505 [Gammaproteobacteria bacterium]|nr:hypothetical protein [Gammaproteobacteria bacterium]HRX70937.1 hypothetical protein [Candidatus Competibacteraceae bacterium]
MFKPDSPILNFPANLNRRQAFFLDGMRHAFEIAHLAFNRLTTNLADLAKSDSEGDRPKGYAKYYLDAWAFVDAIDRLLALWKMQPNADSIPKDWSSSNLKSELGTIRDIRNVSDHLAQRAEQVISSGTAALGELSWVNVTSIEPPIMKSYLIRPGFLTPSIRGQLNIPKKEIIVLNGSANVLLKAHTYTADLSSAYVRMVDLARYVEFSIKPLFSSAEASKPIGGDLFASCELVFPETTK